MVNTSYGNKDLAFDQNKLKFRSIISGPISFIFFPKTHCQNCHISSSPLNINRTYMLPTSTSSFFSLFSSIFSVPRGGRAASVSDPSTSNCSSMSFNQCSPVFLLESKSCFTTRTMKFSPKFIPIFWSSKQKAAINKSKFIEHMKLNSSRNSRFLHPRFQNIVFDLKNVNQKKKKRRITT
uniref:Uncharacterized protein n=1 Tax=Opuntia streptacantha TaxID=393608 RepID=A0A7C9CSH0_OPUST